MSPPENYLQQSGKHIQRGQGRCWTGGLCVKGFVIHPIQLMENPASGFTYGNNSLRQSICTSLLESCRSEAKLPVVMWVLDKQLKLPRDASSQGSCCVQRETFPLSFTAASIWIYDTCHLELRASLLRFFCSTQENHFGVCLNARMAQEAKLSKLSSPPVYLLILNFAVHNSRLRCR